MDRRARAVEVEAVEIAPLDDPLGELHARDPGNQQIDRLAGPRTEELALAVQLGTGVLIEFGGDAPRHPAREGGRRKRVRQGRPAEALGQRIEQPLGKQLEPLPRRLLLWKVVESG